MLVSILFAISIKTRARDKKQMKAMEVLKMT